MTKDIPGIGSQSRIRLKNSIRSRHIITIRFCIPVLFTLFARCSVTPIYQHAIPSMIQPPQHV
jgi:hypothetical protein